MILVTCTYEVITPESAENGEVEETGFLWEHSPHTFRELVDLMKDHPEASCWPATGDTREWYTCYDEMGDLQTGATTEHSIHYSRYNNPRNAKYWRWAAIAAGIVKE